MLRMPRAGFGGGTRISCLVVRSWPEKRGGGGIFGVEKGCLRGDNGVCEAGLLTGTG